MESKELLRSLFDIIRETKLTDCEYLVSKWLEENFNYLISDNKSEKLLYRTGMVAFASIQKKNAQTELYWLNIWKDAESYWWAAAFFGLRLQNPQLAARELPLLMSRKVEKSTQILTDMWKDDSSKNQLENEIKKGLKNNDTWSGLILNSILEKISDNEKNVLLSNLK